MKLVKINKTDAGWEVAYFDGKIVVYPYEFYYNDPELPRIWVDETKIKVHVARLIRGTPEQMR